MIKSITLRNTRSFRSEPVSINFDGKRVAAFYGHNGTGKTTISEYIRNRSDNEFKECLIKFQSEDEPEILVYNENFIEENFRNSDTQPGVFTVNKTNVDIANQINEKRQEVKAIDKDIEDSEEVIKGYVESKESHRGVLMEKAWKFRTKHQNKSLEYCMKGRMGSKPAFLKAVEEVGLEEILFTDDELEQEARVLLDQESKEKSVIDSLNLGFHAIESNQLLKEAVVPSSDTELSALIDKLQSHTWVDQGRKYLEVEHEKCPFCQQPQPSSLKEDLEKIFDNTYREAKKQLTELKDEYDHLIISLKDTMNSSEWKEDLVKENAELQGSISHLIGDVEDNLKKIKIKEDSPEKSVELKSTNQLLQKINSIIGEISQRQIEYNKRLNSRSESLKIIEDRFWKFLRSKLDDDIQTCNKEIAKLDESINKYIKSVQSLQDKKAQALKEIDTLIKGQTNIEEAMIRISSRIKELGLSGFSISKVAGDQQEYCLVRDSSPVENVYKTLSEGEKTLISFLYFIEMCKGSSSDSSDPDLKNRVIVIDDPISSLSHNYVFDVASLIQYEIINSEVLQVIYLTHSLFFFHEMLKIGEKTNSYALFRVVKNESTNIICMDKEEVRNEYESFWQILKDARKGNVASVAVPNMIRNILEHYFSFVYRMDKLSSRLSELEVSDKEYQPFYRYINRNSHSDAINLTDFGEVDPERYINKMKEIFDSLGALEHYNHMMGE